MMNIDCQTWEGLNLGLMQVKEMGGFAQADEIERELDRLAAGVLADPRRVEAVGEASPTTLREMQARAASDRQASAQPGGSALADGGQLAAELANLNDEQLAAVGAAVAAERARRNAA